MKAQTINAYKQSPWRKQVQRYAWILVVLIFFAIMAITNLNISAANYAAGVVIQDMESQQEEIDHHIADLRNQLGNLTSLEVMARRASEEGFNFINQPSQIIYLPITGYQAPQVAVEAPASKSRHSNTLVKPNYTQSLWDLFRSGALKLTKNPQRSGTK